MSLRNPPDISSFRKRKLGRQVVGGVYKRASDRYPMGKEEPWLLARRRYLGERGNKDVKTRTGTGMLGDLGTGDDPVTLGPDTLKMDAPASDINDDKDARPNTHHSGRCDLEFMDGHTAFLRLSQFYLDQVPQNRWFAPN